MSLIRTSETNCTQTMNQSFKNLVRKLLSDSSWEKLQEIVFDIRLKRVQMNHQTALMNVRTKPCIKVAFFLIHEPVWKYEGIYRLMEKDSRFEPIVIVCPYLVYGEEVMLEEMHKACEAFKKSGYQVIKSLNEKTGKWLNVKKEIRPDVIFFTNPYLLTKKEYHISSYIRYLTCYVPYNFGNSHLYQMMHNLKFHNSLWRFFAETPLHKEFSVKYANNKGVNVLVTGFPGIDTLLDKNHVPTYIWKQKGKDIKKIIWAPHHTIDDNKSALSYSTFLMYADFMLQIANVYKGKIQVAFKPHPILKYKLYELPEWGKERTESFYNQWTNMENGQLVEGDYIDLFLTSDALIHDSGSFLIEYLYTGKPVLHTDRDPKITERMNEFGVLAYNLHYQANTEDQIREFIENVLNDQDDKKKDRETFLASRLLPPNHRSASENIYNELVEQLCQFPQQ
jgi:hypothetical protein